jgi:hypothetical protein
MITEDSRQRTGPHFTAWQAPCARRCPSSPGAQPQNTSAQVKLADLHVSGERLPLSRGEGQHMTACPTYSVSMMEFTDGLVTYETQYFAGPFQAPSSRAALAEPIPGRDP